MQAAAGSSIASTVTYMSPVVAVIVGVIFLHEPLRGSNQWADSSSCSAPRSDRVDLRLSRQTLRSLIGGHGEVRGQLVELLVA